MKKFLLLGLIFFCFSCDEKDSIETQKIETTPSQYKEHYKTIFVEEIYEPVFPNELVQKTLSKLNTQAESLIKDGWTPIGSVTPVYNSNNRIGYLQTFFR